MAASIAYSECSSCDTDLYNYKEMGLERIPRLLSCGHLLCSECADGFVYKNKIICHCSTSCDYEKVEDVPIPSFSPVARSLKIPNDSDTKATINLNRQSSFKEFCARIPAAGSMSTESVAHTENSKNNTCSTLTCCRPNCSQKRITDGYFCAEHQAGIPRVTPKSIDDLNERLTALLQSSEILDKHEFPSHLKKTFAKQECISSDEALSLIEKAINIFSLEPNVLNVKAPIRIVGDLHGQYSDLLNILDMFGMPGEKGGYLFLGDYVNRGQFSCEVMLYLLSLKIKHPEEVYLLRGNHECRSLTVHYGFKDECKAKYGLQVYNKFIKLFKELPLSAIVTAREGQYFCCHGGISPDLEVEKIKSIERRAEPSTTGELCNILWSDPVEDLRFSTPLSEMDIKRLEVLLGESYTFNELRRCSYSFGYLAAVQFLEKHNFLSLIRAHSVQEDGSCNHFNELLECYRNEKKKQTQSPHYKFINESSIFNKVDTMKSHRPAVITVFSAPNYCGSYGNKGAILTIGDKFDEPEACPYGWATPPTFVERKSSRADDDMKIIEKACPYMPIDFREFMRFAWMVGPAQPLNDTSRDAEQSSEASDADDLTSPSNVDNTMAMEYVVVPATSGSMDSHENFTNMVEMGRIGEIHPDLRKENQVPKKYQRKRSMKDFWLNALVGRFKVKSITPSKYFNKAGKILGEKIIPASDDTCSIENEMDKEEPLAANMASLQDDACQMGYEVTDEELLALKLYFNILDCDCTNYIDWQSLQSFAMEDGDFAQESEIKLCIDAADIDGDGKIDMLDFLSAAARLKTLYEANMQSANH